MRLRANAVERAEAAPAEVEAPLPAGSEIAPGYEVIDHLHRSQALDAYDVWSHERQCRCVAKTLRPDRLGDAGPRERLEREGSMLERFSHSHIVRAYETLARPRLVVILETLTGATLAHLIAHSRRRLGALDIACLGVHLCSAVHYLHGQGILHLDLKPGNVVAGDDGRARVLDLSLARPPGPAHAGIGTRMYMSPEQARGGTLEPPADVWGIGAVLWEAAAGRGAFADEAGGDRYPQLERRADPIRRRRRRLPTALAEGIDACLEPAPERRPELAVLARRLNAVLA
jgi:eukaryotic-like serine/threonine-protein kinase